MSRFLLVIHNDFDRAKAAMWARKAPLGMRIEYKPTKRTLPQNDLMWDMLTDVATQAEHNGRKYAPDQWKCIFMAALGKEVQFIPSLDGKTFIPMGLSSSDLSVKEMSDLIDFMGAWGAENGVAFRVDQREAVA